MPLIPKIKPTIGHRNANPSAKRAVFGFYAMSFATGAGAGAGLACVEHPHDGHTTASS